MKEISQSCVDISAGILIQSSYKPQPEQQWKYKSSIHYIILFYQKLNGFLLCSLLSVVN